jgi:2-keto-4-pentenoate hydratase/2-oxohepta-3-ene-1,7-dioic acid hydratase in catechol pathway
MEWRLATVEGPDGTRGGRPAAVVDGHAYALAGVASTLQLLEDWEAAQARVEQRLDDGTAEPLGPVDELRLLAPVTRPPNIYMAGANYADHAREMHGLGPDAPVARPPQGPFMFLKPTTTLIGHRAPVLLPPGAKVDWEVELAAVIGRRAHHVAAADALAYVAGYTIVNDVSVRDRFRREGAEPPMTFDWFAQKGWHTSCPCGPWLVPAADIARPGDLALRLRRSGALEQDSRTSEMIFGLEELIAYLSDVVPLVPGDLIATGTCAGVGMAKGRFLVPGDVMVAEIEGIGALENPVEAA